MNDKLFFFAVGRQQYLVNR